MQSPKLALLYGITIWVSLIVASLLLQVAETGASPLFESMKFIVLAMLAVTLTTLYVKAVKQASAAEGVLVGTIWMAITISLDLALYALGLFNLSVGAYFQDVASSYLIMPITGLVIMGSLQTLENRA